MRREVTHEWWVCGVEEGEGKEEPVRKLVPGRVIVGKKNN